MNFAEVTVACTKQDPLPLGRGASAGWNNPSGVQIRDRMARFGLHRRPRTKVGTRIMPAPEARPS